MILKVCSVRPIVANCDTLYSAALAVLGKGIMYPILRATMFGHFCAGEDSKSIAPRIEAMREVGVGSILDYAAEAEVDAANNAGGSDGPAQQPSAEERIQTTARVYDYTSEEKADANAVIFEKAVRAVRDTSPEGFAAVKVSGLGDPKLLERVSTALVEIRNFFQRVRAQDPEGQADGGDPYLLTYAQFRRGWEQFFTIESEEEISAAFERMGGNQKTGTINYNEWVYHLQPEDLNALVSRCRATGALSLATLDEVELQLLANLRRRVHGICKLANDLGVRVMLDAEWTEIQPAIDHLAIKMQREFNRERAVVFNTYQTYLTSTGDRLRRNIQRADQEGWAFGAKLVRGAYMVSERANAEKAGRASPIWGDYEETEACFHRAIEESLEFVSRTQSSSLPAEVMVASHNQRSVQLVVRKMQELGMPRDSPVYIGQLLGMADHLTMTLGSHGYKAYKYVPYGPVGEVVPYLIRRTQENSTFLGSPGVAEERGIIFNELRRRLAPFQLAA
jgi:proline dehydrogenase